VFLLLRFVCLGSRPDEKVEDIVSTSEPLPVGYNGNAVRSFLLNRWPYADVSTLQSMNYSSLPQCIKIDLWVTNLLKLSEPEPAFYF
jgi:hypothetical protein